MTETAPRPPSLAILFAMMFTSQLALTIFLPAIVEMGEDLSASLTQVQLVIPAYLAAFAVMQLAAGPLADAFGRRPVILGGLALFVLSSMACGLSVNIEQLLFARFFQAMGACTTIVVGRAIIRDGVEGKAAARALSYSAIALAAGPAMAPFFGGFLTSWFDWRATFYATGLIGLISLVAAIPRFVETLQADQRRPPNLVNMARNYRELAGNRVFMGYSLCISFLSGTFQTFIVAAPIVMIGQMDVPPRLFGFYVMIVPTFFMAGSYISTRLNRFFSMDQIIAAGCVVAVIGGIIQFTLAFTGTSTPITILMATLISNFGTGLGFSNCYAQALSMVPSSIAGAASALTGFLHMGWAFILSLALANIAMITPIELGLSQTVTAFSASAAFLVLVWLGRARSKAT